MTLSRSKRLTANTDHDWREVGGNDGGWTVVKCTRCKTERTVPPGKEPPAKWCDGLKRSELERGSGPAPVSDRKGEKRAHQRDEAFREYVRGLPCCACGKGPPSDPHHVRNWGAGHGDWLPDGAGNLSPLCRTCHGELDSVGMGERSFERFWDVRLDEEARRIGEGFEASEDGGE